MSEYYTNTQSDAQASIIGARIKSNTSEASILAKIAAANDRHLITDAEQSAIALIPPLRYKGEFASLAALNAAVPVGSSGDNATIVNTGGDDTKAIWDEDAGAFIDTGAALTAETPGSILAKYHQNANTEHFTTARKTKLDNLTEATDISAFTSALDAALA